MIKQEEITQIILKDLGIGHLSEEDQEKIVTKLGENIIKRLTLTILTNLPEEVQDEFDSLNNAGDQEKLQEFLKAQIPNLDEIMKKTTTDTINEFKELAGITS